jgi:hypothetical protein
MDLLCRHETMRSIPSPAYAVSLVVRSCANIFCGLVKASVFPFLAICTFMPFTNWPAAMDNVYRIKVGSIVQVILSLKFGGTSHSFIVVVQSPLFFTKRSSSKWLAGSYSKFQFQLRGTNDKPEHTRTKATLSRCLASMFAWSCNDNPKTFNNSITGDTKHKN